MSDIGYWASFAAGTILLVMSALGIRGFLWRVFDSRPPAPKLLAIAIVLGFVAIGANTFYWQVFGRLAVWLGLLSGQQLNTVGFWLDVPLKLMAATAVYLHLAALRLRLPPEERRRWTVLGMAFYPRRTGLLSQFLNAFTRGER